MITALVVLAILLLLWRVSVGLLRKRLLEIFLAIPMNEWICYADLRRQLRDFDFVLHMALCAFHQAKFIVVDVDAEEFDKVFETIELTEAEFAEASALSDAELSSFEIDNMIIECPEVLRFRRTKNPRKRRRAFDWWPRIGDLVEPATVPARI